MKTVFFLLLAFLCFHPLSAPAQVVSGTGNQCVVQLDKAFYVTGEVVWYALFTPYNENFDSAVVEVTVLDSEGRLMKKHFQRLREGSAHGYLQIPYDWNSGVYYLIVNGFQSDASLVELISVPLPLYNDLTFVPDPEGSGIPPSSEERSPRVDHALTIEIKTNKPVYGPREPVRATIQVRDADGKPVKARLSVAVVDAVLCGESSPAIPTIHFGKMFWNDFRLSKKRLFAGMVRHEAGQPLQTFYLAGYQSDSHRLHFARSDATGRFNFELPDFYGQRPFQLTDYQSENIKTRLEDHRASRTPLPLPFNETIGRYIQLSRQRKKINKVFNTQEMSLHPEFPAVDSGRFEADRELRIADYTRMEDLPAFFREISTPLKFRREGAQYIAKMFNPARRAREFYDQDPIFFIDGQLTRNADFVAGLDMKNIESIELFFDSDKLYDQFGVLGNNGVVRIFSLTGSFQVPEEDARNIFRIEGFQPPASFPELPTAGPLHPLFRPQLWWAPKVQTDERGQAQIEFRNADALSTFRISVLAGDIAGNTGTGEAAYHVRVLNN